ncbi:MAG TPA: beta-propeller domain-containing protein, partial [Burkholderiaceae bacterium]|nr:beta-propeller domain-containing protein [Burkholderiaceae bacterium]
MPAVASPFGTTRHHLAAAVLCGPLLIAGCGGGSSSPAPTREGPALAASRSGELVEQVRALLLRRDAQRQQSPGTPLAPAGSGPVLGVAASGTPVAFSNTNVQEAGVDEEDLIKTDGTSVYALDTTAFSGSAPAMRLL